MINLHADNISLYERAARIVSSIAGYDTAVAQALLEKSYESVTAAIKTAILLAAGSRS